jgi:hypothetical protein
MTELEFERQLQSIGNGMEYPRTPDVAGYVMARLGKSKRSRFISRRLAWSLTTMLVFLSSLMLIPTVRAAVIEFIQVGIVRIFPQPVEPTPEGIVTATPQNVIKPSEKPTSITFPTATPTTTLPLLIPFLDQIAGETKLADAQKTAPYPILLPTYPADLGLPNHVYVQDADGVMTILVWTDPQEPEHVTMSLHFIPAGHWAINKFGPVVVEETEVNGQKAVWAVGPYPLVMRNGDIQFDRMINGHVLIWAHEDITYRLETELPLEEAIKIAESLQPVP